ncbi:MAG: hypothetical protein A4E53_04546 [Pelotomaculum sp. PtaB.Bin104]|nr:MAG: hypothetical protein A4E53_04546 [Pelotomaculum sp. PtaB.Bin104]
MGHHHSSYSKIHKYGLFLDLFKQLSNKRSSRDLFNGLPLSNWLGTAGTTFWAYRLQI